MATLTDADFTQIKQWIQRQPTIEAEFRAWGLTKNVWRAALQAIETYQVAALTATPASSIKSAIEVETGATNNTRASYIWIAWVQWKIRNFLGGL